MINIKELAREMCKIKQIDPDAKCVAVQPETEQALGKDYAAWQYQAWILEQSKILEEYFGA